MRVRILSEAIVNGLVIREVPWKHGSLFEVENERTPFNTWEKAQTFAEQQMRAP